MSDVPTECPGDAPQDGWLTWISGVVWVVVEFPWEQLVFICVVTFPLEIVPPKG